MTVTCEYVRCVMSAFDSTSVEFKLVWHDCSDAINLISRFVFYFQIFTPMTNFYRQAPDRNANLN